VPSPSPSVTTLVLVKAGSRYETLGNWGISHFVEHMMFKGTRKRPTTLDLSRELDGVGADYNAYTGKDRTGYYVKSDASKLELALDFLSDVLLNSKLKAEEIKKESEVIIEEIKMYEDNPLFYIEDIFEQTVFQGNTLERTIAGSRESVKSINRGQMVDYLKTRYLGQNMVLVLAGRVNEEALKLIRKYFAPFQGSAGKSGKKFDFTVFEKKQKRVQVKHLSKETEQVQLIMGFPALSYFDDRLPVLTVLSVILGGNMSSRFFIKIREKMGLCYFIKSELDVYQDTGSFKVHLGLDSRNLEKAIRAINQEFENVVQRAVLDEELRRAKDYIAGKLSLALENTAYLAQFFGDQELLENRLRTPEEKLDQVRLVTQDQIQVLAEEILRKDSLNIALIGKGVNTESIKDLLSI